MPTTSPLISRLLKTTITMTMRDYDFRETRYTWCAWDSVTRTRASVTGISKNLLRLSLSLARSVAVLASFGLRLLFLESKQELLFSL